MRKHSVNKEYLGEKFDPLRIVSGYDFKTTTLKLYFVFAITRDVQFLLKG